MEQGQCIFEVTIGTRNGQVLAVFSFAAEKATDVCAKFEETLKTYERGAMITGIRLVIGNLVV